jgi:hypothetical protein
MERLIKEYNMADLFAKWASAATNYENQEKL